MKQELSLYYVHRVSHKMQVASGQESFGPLNSAGLMATRRMRCECCKICWEYPGAPGHCIYGGPFRYENEEE